jgi:hypothetical protein
MEKIIIPIARGDYLTNVGYNVHLSKNERRRKLIKAVKKYSYKSIVLRLNAVSIRLRNVAPDTYEKLRNDMAYLKRKFRS